MRALLTALTLLTLAPTALAGDRFGVQQVAFSPDGTRALVVTGGVQDGSGFSVAALTALNTEQGQPLLEASVRSATQPVPATVNTLLAREHSRLLALGLLPGRLAQPVYTRTYPAQIGRAHV